jgi:uncharacterized protein
MMKAEHLRAVFTALAVALIIVALQVQVQAREEIKDRMRERLPEIIELKARGIIGETSGGFLAFVGSERVREDLVEAENRDRRQVYAAIARQQSITPEYVGQRRARQIAEQAGPGAWLQDQDGNWYRKR